MRTYYYSRKEVRNIQGEEAKQRIDMVAQTLLGRAQLSKRIRNATNAVIFCSLSFLVLWVVGLYAYSRTLRDPVDTKAGNALRSSGADDEGSNVNSAVGLPQDRLFHESPRPAASNIKLESRSSTYIPPDHHLVDNSGEPFNRVHIFYYSWWGTPAGPLERAYTHWNHPVLPHWQASVNEQYKDRIGKVYQPPDEIGANFYPESGAYSSSDPVTIERHAAQIRASEVSVVVLSWYPPGKSDAKGVPELADRVVPILLEIFLRHNLKLAFHIEPYEKRTAQSVWSDAEYIALRYGTHPGIARVKGVPLIYVYDSYLIPKDQWAKVGQAKDMSRRKNACFFGLVVERAHVDDLASSNGFFDGVYTYFAADGFVWGSTRSSWQDLVTLSREKGLLTSLSVGPGYIDTKIRPWNGANTRERETGAYFRKSFIAAGRAKPDFLSITSFNEWHEGTQIEPAIQRAGFQDYTDTTYRTIAQNDAYVYLNLTANLVKEFFTP
jgi:glycoprotein endo-alpha-1,2-mannosidase